MTDGYIQLPADSAGKKISTRDCGSAGHMQYFIEADGRAVSYQGRCGTFRIPGRGGLVGQKLFTIFNNSGSPVKLDLEKVAVDVLATVVKAVTTMPPVLRLTKFTAVNSGGTALTKVSEDSSLYPSSSSFALLFGDASADGTGSATALAAALVAGTIWAEEFAPRLITAAGYELFDRTVFLELDKEHITLNANEGACLFLDYVSSLSNPTTDNWVVAARWTEYNWL